MAYDEILDGAYLQRAPADAVYSWLREAHIEYDSRPHFYSGVSVDIESMLVSRNDETIDLGLAQWANYSETLRTLFARWWRPCPTDGWVAKGTLAHSLLCGMLSNTSVISHSYSEAGAGNGLPEEVLDWIVQYGDDEYVRRLHRNDCVSLFLIRKCCRREGIYAVIPDKSWFRVLISLSTSKRFQRPAKEYDDSPDMFHWDVHRGIIDAVKNAPKTLAASNVLWSVLNRVPPEVAKDAYAPTKDLMEVANSWEVDIQDDDPHGHHREDSLGPAERVQFHLLRLYCSSADLDPENERRVIRLASYAKSYFSGAKGLRIEDFKKYADRDGPSFMYAASYNGNIWERHAASIAMLHGGFPSPENSEYLHYNHPAFAEQNRAIDVARANIDEDVAASPVANLSLDTQALYAQLSAQVKSLKSWVVWVAVAAVVVLKW